MTHLIPYVILAGLLIMAVRIAFDETARRKRDEAANYEVEGDWPWTGAITDSTGRRLKPPGLSDLSIIPRNINGRN